MSNAIAPSAIIFINNDLSDSVKATIQRQLFIDDTMIGSEFDNRFATDPSYIIAIHANGLRILVIRPFTEYTNRNLADLVLFVKDGLISVEYNKVGAPNQTYAIPNITLAQLFNSIKLTNIVPCR